jgi:hypothetical protein
MPETKYTSTATKPFGSPLRFGLNGEGVNIETISAARTMDAYGATVQILNGGASNRDVTLPPIATSNGMLVIVQNSGTTNDLVVKDNAGTPATIATLKPNSGAAFLCNGTTWYPVLHEKAPFLSAQQTGTGSAQNVAHGLGFIPKVAFAIPETSFAAAPTYGTHTATNVVVTVTAAETFRIVAW